MNHTTHGSRSSKARRTTHRSASGKKLYAKRDGKGRFKDVQTFERAHRADLKRKSKAESAKSSKSTSTSNMKPKRANKNQGIEAFSALAGDQPEALANVDEEIVDGCRAALVLNFTTKCLRLHANPDDDTLIVSAAAISDPLLARLSRVSNRRPWSDLLGKTFGWGWLTVNQQGYCDGALLSFDTLEPCLLVSVAASNIRVHVIEPEATRESDPVTGAHAPVA